jgi:hypothetical protein
MVRPNDYQFVLPVVTVRVAMACQFTDSVHLVSPLHAKFMKKLSEGIFSVNKIDLKALRDTLNVQGADDAVFQSVTKAQLRRFCRRDMNPKEQLIGNLEGIFKLFQEVEGRALIGRP